VSSTYDVVMVWRCGMMSLGIYGMWTDDVMQCARVLDGQSQFALSIQQTNTLLIFISDRLA